MNRAQEDKQMSKYTLIEILSNLRNAFLLPLWHEISILANTLC